MVSTRTDLLYEMMRNSCSTWMTASDRELEANVKKFIADKCSDAEVEGGLGGSCAGSGGKSSFGGRTPFSPKKKVIDSRPAILARKSWTISINRMAGTVTVEGDCFSASIQCIMIVNLSF